VPASVPGAQPCTGRRRQDEARQRQAADAALRGERTVWSWLSPWRTRGAAVKQGRQAAWAGLHRGSHGHAVSEKQHLEPAVHERHAGGTRHVTDAPAGRKDPGGNAAMDGSRPTWPPPSRESVSQPAAKPLRRAVCHWLNWHGLVCVRFGRVH
jgi:hypothetical protein